MNLPAFKQELLKLGTTDHQRAVKLNMSRAALIEYKAGRLPIQLERLLRQPQLLRALADDAEAAPTTEHSRGEDGWRADSPPEVCP